MVNRPSWCPDPECSPLTSLWDVGRDKTGTCIGKLSEATDHGSSKGINDKRWCINSSGLSQLMLNNGDMEFFIYQMAVAAKKGGKPLTFWLLKGMEREGG